jgi:hypothetical protein
MASYVIARSPVMGSNDAPDDVAAGQLAIDQLDLALDAWLDSHVEQAHELGAGVDVPARRLDHVPLGRNKRTHIGRKLRAYLIESCVDVGGCLRYVGRRS